jgi:hypothetical protein
VRDPLLAGVLPLVAQAALVAWMRDHGAATVMLGAAAGSTPAAIAAMAVALALRVYTVVALPGLCVAWLATRAWAAVARAAAARAQRGASTESAAGSASKTKSSNPMP